MYNQILKAKPYVIMLKKMDYWYWCRYFIDLYRSCNYKCSYCETIESRDVKGLHTVPGLPDKKESIGLGLFSDIYSPNPLENKVVRSLLNFLYEKGYPISINTKSEYILNDIDIIKEFAKRDMIRVTITLLTLDPELSQELEGQKLKPRKRIEALKALTDEGIPTGVSITPVIPMVNDDRESLERLITVVKKNGAKWILFSGYNPTKEFLLNPKWKKVKLLHKNSNELNLRYKKAKSIILSAVFKENLPIRIPRINLNKNTNGYLLNRITEYLYNISYLYELLDNKLEALRFRRATYTINEIDTPIKALIIQNKLGYIKGISPKIEAIIKEIAVNDGSSYYEKLLKKLKMEY